MVCICTYNSIVELLCLWTVGKPVDLSVFFKLASISEVIWLIKAGDASCSCLRLPFIWPSLNGLMIDVFFYTLLASSLSFLCFYPEVHILLKLSLWKGPSACFSRTARLLTCSQCAPSLASCIIEHTFLQNQWQSRLSVVPFGFQC